MTVQEAIKILNPETSADALLEIGYYGGFNGKMAQIQAVIDASVIAVECMEKQIPKEPIPNCSFFKCPSCESFDIENFNDSGGSTKNKFCPDCGQALKWGEEDE